jgi:hypothetical protein
MNILVIFIAVALVCLGLLVSKKIERFSYVPKMNIVEEPKKEEEQQISGPINGGHRDTEVRRIVRTLQVNTNTYVF